MTFTPRFDGNEKKNDAFALFSVCILFILSSVLFIGDLAEKNTHTTDKAKRNETNESDIHEIKPQK